MCGIIAVVRRPSTRPTPDAQDVVVPVTGMAALLRDAADVTDALHTTADELTMVDALLRGVRNVSSFSQKACHLGSIVAGS